ncbi:aminopeptidase N [Shewanella marina]|uniref:aminopeptidase N n=1 Tax=Shewanella marina TaxID=487319 RepID=UPI00046F76FB|nr:aminopeptidase N [Shewanella marina]
MSQVTAKFLKDYQSPKFTIENINLDVNLLGAQTRVVATSQVQRLDSAAKVLVLDGESLQLSSVKINGQAVEYIEADGKLSITVDFDQFELEIVTILDPAANTSLEGLYMSDGAYCTQCEAEGFRRITYYLDRPDVLAKFTVRIEADKAQFPYLLSNGNPIDAGELDGGRHFVCWQDPFPKPCYLFALVAGDFDLLEDKFTTRSGRDVKLQVFVDKGNLSKSQHAMASLKKAMEWDESRFGLEYDLDIYMIVAVDFFNMGAMENKGLNVFNTKYVLADKATATDVDYHGIEAVIGHEYFHNWTGNRITCRDWFQLSLKEGLTVFRDQEFSSDMGSRAVNRINAIKVIKNQQFAEDTGPMAHPIRPESVMEMNNFYTVTVYNKGAEVIRMLHTLLGEEGFQAGMRLYVERHDGHAVTCDDFVAAMEDASGVDLALFRRWYSQSGTPIVNVMDSYDANKKRYTLTLKQHTPATAEQAVKQALHIPFSIELLAADGHSLLNKVLDFVENEQEFVFDNIDQKPLVSLLQDFSAPVKLVYNFSIEHLVHLMQFATSEVARWEASVNLFSQTVWQNVAKLAAEQAMVVDPRVVDAFRAVMLATDLDAELVAEILTLPSLSALVEQVDSVDLDALTAARRYVVDTIANECEDELLAKYRQLAQEQTIGARALKNSCLILLTSTAVDIDTLVQQQYQQADNMTDSLAALQAANVGALACRQALLTDFEAQWKDTPLVMDKWFALQACFNNEQVFDAIENLKQHSAFSFENPNRVRSIIGSFAMANLAQFHRVDGRGYQLLTDWLIVLNKVNPQVAARMITPLIQFGKFDQSRQQLIKVQLQRLMDLPDLSKDLYEKVFKALA